MANTALNIQNDANKASRPEKSGDPIPKVPIYLAMGVVVSSLLFVFVSTFFEKPSWKVDAGAVVKSRDVILSRQEDETIIVTDASSGAVLKNIPKGEDGFIHSALTGITRERMVKRVPQDAPLRIILAENGRHLLYDTATKHSIYLRAFGKDNAAAFARLLTIKAPTGKEG